MSQLSRWFDAAPTALVALLLLFASTGSELETGELLHISAC